jgi:hypothetical protein
VDAGASESRRAPGFLFEPSDIEEIRRTMPRFMLGRRIPRDSFGLSINVIDISQPFRHT